MSWCCVACANQIPFCVVYKKMKFLFFLFCNFVVEIDVAKADLINWFL